MEQVHEEQPKRRKVAILGFTDSWKLAPFNDPSFEIWGLNELYLFISQIQGGRYDRWFELHMQDGLLSDKKRSNAPPDAHIENLKKLTCPIYMQQHWDDIPNSVTYPMAQICEAFPNPAPGWKPYLTNSISYMLALAIMESFEEIHVYGVDMSHDCVAPDMRVLTADLRWMPASDLKIGQELLAFHEEIPVKIGNGEPAQFRKYRKATVESISALKRPCRRLTMEDGTMLVSSVGHQWLTIGGEGHNRRFLETEKLQAKDVYAVRASNIVKLLETWDEDRSWEAGYLAAAFDGEGHISQGKRDNCQSTHMSVGFAQRPNEMEREVDSSLQKLGFGYYKGKLGEDKCHKYNIKGGRSEILRFLGTVRPKRLLARFDAEQVGTINSVDDVAVLKNEDIGEQPVIGLTTTTGTLIVEGFASHNSEYGGQRPSCEYFIGLAVGKGIKVYIPPTADLLKTVFFYGYEQLQEEGFDTKLKARLQELQGKANQLQAELNEKNNALQQHLGAVQDCQHMVKNWRPLPSK